MLLLHFLKNFLKKVLTKRGLAGFPELREMRSLDISISQYLLQSSDDKHLSGFGVILHRHHSPRRGGESTEYYSFNVRTSKCQHQSKLANSYTCDYLERPSGCSPTSFTASNFYPICNFLLWIRERQRLLAFGIN